MREFDDISQVAQKLIRPGFIFESEESNLLPLRINRGIGKDEFVDILPTLRKIYDLTRKGESQSAALLVSELTGLLVAADLGIAREYLIELEVKRALPKIIRRINTELKRVDTQRKSEEQNQDE